MRKIILDVAVSLDNYIEGPHGEIDWCMIDDDMQFDTFLASVDSILYGRKSYELWGEYLPESNAAPADHKFWQAVHAKKKYVVTTNAARTFAQAETISHNLEQQLLQLKQQSGGHIWLYGGAGLTTSLMNLGLVDELRLSVHPIILGGGTPLVQHIAAPIGLSLEEVKTFRCGVVQLIYRVKDAASSH